MSHKASSEFSDMQITNCTNIDSGHRCMYMTGPFNHRGLPQTADERLTMTHISCLKEWIGKRRAKVVDGVIYIDMPQECIKDRLF